MNVWEALMNWFDRLSDGRGAPPAPAPPEYERPYVRRTTREEDERAEEALRVLGAYVRAQSSRWRDEHRES